MKKNLITTLLLVFFTGSIFAQQCITDAWSNLNQEKVFPAKKAIDNCFAANQENADVWLMRANVYYFLFKWESDFMAKKPAYVRQYPEAILIADESFKKALSLNKDVQAKTKTFDPTIGQLACANYLYEMGRIADSLGKYEETCKYLEAAANNYSLDKKNERLAADLGNIYLLLADCADRADKQDDVMKYLKKSEAVKTPGMGTYLWLYDIYKAEKDTLNCGLVIKNAQKYSDPKDERGQLSLEGYRIDYFAMVKDTAQFLSTADELVAKFPDKPGVLSLVVGHLLNSNYYAKAESLINQGLAIDPNHFDLNNQMGLRFFFEADDNTKLENKLVTSGRFQEAGHYKEAAKKLLEQACPFVEKAYLINGNDRQNNIMLNQILTVLQKPVPADLKAKIEEYNKR